MVHFSTLPFNPDYINRLLSVIHRPCSSPSFPDPCRLIFSLAFHMFEPVSEPNGQDVPPPPSEGFSTHLVFLTKSLRLPATGSFIPLAPTCTTRLSTSDYLSHLASPRERQPLNASLCVPSVPRVRSQKTQIFRT